MPRKPTYEELEQRVQSLEKSEIERKQIKEKLHNSEQHFRVIIDCSPAVIYTKDLHGRYTLINRQFEELSGYGREKVLGKTDFDLFPETVATKSTQNDRKVTETGNSLEIREKGPVKGEMHTFKSIKYPLKNDNGEIYGICGVSTDITERK